MHKVKIMKKIIQLSIALFAVSAQAQTTIYDTVSTGALYANQVWYSLSNDEVGSQPKDDWDLAIEISGFNSSIMVNTQKEGLTVYQTPFNWSQWSQFDTTGYKQWNLLHNSDSLWDIGALNKTGTYNSSDLGWGTYDGTTHMINGTRLFLITSASGMMKLGVQNLANGAYTITYAKIDNSDSTTFTVAKTDYTDRNFAYYTFATKALTNREPSNKTWDLTFTRYIYNNYPLTGGGTMPYPVTGVLLNKKVKAAEVRNTYIPTTNDYTNQTFGPKISEIGSDWKAFTGSTYMITDSLVFFVQDLSQNIWKVVMTGFAGGSTGNYMFSKQKLGNLSVASVNESNKVYVYPNPVSSNGIITLLTDLDNTLNNVSISITDVNGRVLYEDTKPVQNAMGAYEIQNINTNGIYFINLKSDNLTVTKKIIVF